MSTYRDEFPLPSAPLEGLCINYTSVPGAFGTTPDETATLRQGGFRWARQWVYRTDVQNATTGVYGWGQLDEYVNELSSAGFRIMFVLVDTIDGSGHYPALTDPDDIQRYADFCAQMAKRYARFGGIFEIWNEPNGTGNWDGGDPSGEEYAAMAVVACKSIRDMVGEDAYIAGPAIGFSTDLDADYYGAFQDFQEACMAAGLGEYWDMITMHSYRYIVPQETIREPLRYLKNLIANSTERNIVVGISEAGIPSTSFSSGPDLVMRGTDYVPSFGLLTGSISHVTNTSPIVVTSPNHGLSNGSIITITGVMGITAANNTWMVELDPSDPDKFTLLGSVTAGGTHTANTGTWKGAVGKNLLQWTEDLTNPVWAADFGDFVKSRCEPPAELPAGTVAWNLSRDGGSGTYGIWQQNGITLKAGHTYTISAWMRSATDTHTVFLNLTGEGGDAGAWWGQKFKLTTEWIRYEHTFPMAMNYAQMFRIQSKGGTGETSDIQVCNLMCQEICEGTDISDPAFRAAQLENQARDHLDLYRAALNEGVFFYCVYTVRDFQADPTNAGTGGLNHLGVLDLYGQPKPVYNRFKALSEDLALL